MEQDFWVFVRENIIGRNAVIRTPFGKRKLTYADYTASGRGLLFIERYMQKVLELYGNTHSEDDATGMITTERLHQAEKTIKRLLNAGEQYKIIEDGTGATGAVHRLQQILGVYIPPAAKDSFQKLLARYFQGKELKPFESFLLQNRPLVFVGPYEHHSNEVSWRECLTEGIEIDLTEEGLLDLDDLETKLSRKEFRHRQKIGALSAASNVSGVVTPVYEVARVLHRHQALAFFDFAAIAPYGEIDVCRDAESYFDGIYFSPHKFLGGPGSTGILIIHQKIYRKDLAPTIGAGGTVEYVSFHEQQYYPEIEIREKPGTPGILQIMRTALVMELKQKLDPERILKREKELIRRALKRFNACNPIEIIGNKDPDKRIAIFSFNIRLGTSYLHPRFVTILLNDLFGIQSRAGCSCAGPYGHRVLHIDEKKSLKFKERLMHGYSGVKPGWARLNFHFLMTDEEFDFIFDAICFVCRYGKYFLSLYRFDIHTGIWFNKGYSPPKVTFGLEEAVRAGEGEREERSLQELFGRYKHEALKIAEALKNDFDEKAIKTTEKDLIPFVYL
ncbi:MAG TPA: aminotransferase class V-fold PLP-dependent enzyme [bacterium]|nr:aminotransferase class V-fold PLP-dependent enzyme [bacterium]